MKVLRFILLANIVVTASTLLFFAYRYTWFGIATIPDGRWATAVFIAMVSLGSYVVLDQIIKDNYK